MMRSARVSITPTALFTRSKVALSERPSTRASPIFAWSNGVSSSKPSAATIFTLPRGARSSRSPSGATMTVTRVLVLCSKSSRPSASTTRRTSASSALRVIDAEMPVTVVRVPGDSGSCACAATGASLSSRVM